MIASLPIIAEFEFKNNLYDFPEFIKN